MGRKSNLKKQRKVEQQTDVVKESEDVKGKKDYFRIALLVIEGLVAVGLLFLIFNKALIEVTTTRTLMWWIYLIAQIGGGLFIFKRSEGKYKSIYHWEFTLITLAYVIFATI